jgi:hypothetical protein
MILAGVKIVPARVKFVSAGVELVSARAKFIKELFR